MLPGVQCHLLQEQFRCALAPPHVFTHTFGRWWTNQNGELSHTRRIQAAGLTLMWTPVPGRQVAPAHVEEKWVRSLAAALRCMAEHHANIDGSGPFIRQDPNVPRLSERCVPLKLMWVRVVSVKELQCCQCDTFAAHAVAN